MDNDEKGLLTRGPNKGKLRCGVGRGIRPPFVPGARDVSDLLGKCMFPAVEGSEFCKLHDAETNAAIVAERNAASEGQTNGE